MKLSAGNTWLETQHIIGIFELDITSQSLITREFLKRSEQRGLVINAAEDIPKTFTLCREGKTDKVVLSQYATTVLRNRAERKECI